jgi:hypothetical protein
VRIQQAIDRARGPVKVTRERPGPGGAGEVVITYCDVHREHRSIMGTLVDMPEVESVSDEPL